MKDKNKTFIEIILIILFFIIISYIVQTNIISITGIIGGGFFGMFFYVILVITAIVIAPISSVPLIPLASSIWGWFISAILSIIGWTIGSIIAFVLARKYGVPLISKFISINKINKLEKLVPKENVFWSIVFLRMSIPVDILSYALGLFSKITLKHYFLATLIGVTPFAFVFAYAGTISFYYQIFALVIALFIFLIGLLIVFRKRKVIKR